MDVKILQHETALLVCPKSHRNGIKIPFHVCNPFFVAEIFYFEDVIPPKLLAHDVDLSNRKSVFNIKNVFASDNNIIAFYKLASSTGLLLGRDRRSSCVLA